MIRVIEQDGIELTGTGMIAVNTQILPAIEVVAKISQVQKASGIGGHVFPVAVLDAGNGYTLAHSAASIGEQKPGPIATVVVPPNAIRSSDVQP